MRALPGKSLWVIFFFNSLVIYLQVRSPTGVHGKAASGALHEAMSSPDTSGSTLEQSHSNAATATGECADKCIFTMARPAFHEFKKKEMEAEEVEGSSTCFSNKEM